MLSQESSVSKALKIFNNSGLSRSIVQYCAIEDFAIVQRHIKLHTLRENLQHLNFINFLKIELFM